MKISSNQARRQRLIGEAGSDAVEAARRAILRYELRRFHKHLHEPQGYVDMDKRWFPHPAEDPGGYITGRRAKPTVTFPLSFEKACCALQHCARLEGLPDTAHAMVRALKAEAKECRVTSFLPGASGLDAFFDNDVQRYLLEHMGVRIPDAGVPITPRKRL